MNVRQIGFAMLLALGVVVQSGAAAVGLEAIVKEQRQIEAELSQGDMDDLTPRSKRLLKSTQDDIFSIAEGKSSLDDMSPDDQIRFKNAVEQVNSIVSNSRRVEEKKDFCWRERQVGSQVMKTVCGTEEERKAIRQGARDYLNRPRTCVPPGCGEMRSEGRGDIR